MLPNLGARRWMVVTISIELAMDHKPSHRELASVLISDLYQKVISQRDIGKGMENLNYLPFSKFYIPKNNLPKALTKQEVSNVWWNAWFVHFFFNLDQLPATKQA